MYYSRSDGFLMMANKCRSAFTIYLKDTSVGYLAADRQSLTVSGIPDLHSSGYRTSLSPLNQPVDRIYQQTISQCGSPDVSVWTGKDI